MSYVNNEHKLFNRQADMDMVIQIFLTTKTLIC